MFFRTVDSIVADLNRKADLLERVAARHIEKAARHEAEAQKIVDKAHAARTEHARATRLVGRFRELLS